MADVVESGGTAVLPDEIGEAEKTAVFGMEEKMKRILSYGMVGGGKGSLIGPAHRRAIAMDGKAVLRAGCFSRNEDNNRQTGTEWGVEQDRIYRNYEEMAEAEKGRTDAIDFVVIVTPNVSHYPIAKAFLNAGIAVVCDKPLAVTAEQAEELYELSNEKGILFMVTYVYSGYTTAKQIRRMVEQGAIGRIRTIAAEYPQGWLAQEDMTGNKQADWRLNPEQAGKSNTLADIGTHIENTVHRMTGLSIRRLMARMEHVVPGRVLDDNSAVWVEYDNGASGMYWASQIAIGHDNGLRIRIYGERGSLHWFQEEGEKILYYKEDGSRLEIHKGDACIEGRPAVYDRMPGGHSEGWFGALANHYCNFVECLCAQKSGEACEHPKEFPDAYDGLSGMRFIEACVESQEKGNVWIEMGQDI